MSSDKLLFWMSARTSGSWQQFRTAVEELHLDADEDGDADMTDEVVGADGLSLYQALRLNLQRLGHAEFITAARALEWRVTPPSVAIIPQHDHVFGIVAGARSLKLLDRLSSVAGDRLETLQLPSCPALLRVRGADDREVEDIAVRAGFQVQKDAARALLACLPPVDDTAVRRPYSFPLGSDWRIDQFEPRTLRWVPSDRDAAVAARRALFRFSLGHQRYVLLCDRGLCFQIPAQVGKYVVARRRHRRLLQYDTANRTLTVPAICRPPFLVERALILCSGLPPLYEARARASGLLQYSYVSSEIANLAGSILRQELR